MKKILMMLLGVAFAMFAIAEEVWIEPYSADTNPNDANVSWYSCCFLDLAAVKAATGNQLTTLYYGDFATWLLTSAADNKAATITNASYVMESYEDYWADEQYCFTYNSPQFAAKGYLAVCFFDHGADHAFQVGQIDSRGKYSFDDESAITTGWLALSIAPPQDPIEYLTWDAEAKSLVAATNTAYEVVTAETAAFEDKKWYVVTNTIERAGITVNGEAHLILCDGASLTVTGDDDEAGIEVPEGSALTIYGQSEGTGQLEANGGCLGAGIGSGAESTCGEITINGGKVIAEGGGGEGWAAGIGSGYLNKNVVTITINGGDIEATGSDFAAGIGSCDYDGWGEAPPRTGTDIIIINGGTITATGGAYGAGVGGGHMSFAVAVTINGGTITAATQGIDNTAHAIGNGDYAKVDATVSFGADVEFTIVAGDDEASATATTVADYVENHSAAYVKIEVGSSKSDPIEYLTWDEETKSLVAATNTSYTVVTAETATFEDGWYIVTNSITRGAIKVNGAAHLILCDGASLKVTGDANKAGIEVPADKSLTIYGQSEGTGALTAMGGKNGGAGIGGIRHGTCGTITINGGEINATGGTYGAGIGGSAGGSNGATITINGGTVRATGGLQGAGIGSGNYYDEHVGSRSDTDVIAINGGTITATGGQWGAGIGSGSDGFAATVTINGGTITASTITAEAIGSGDSAKSAATVTFGTALASKYVWAGASATAGEAMTTADFATNHSAAYAEVPVEIYTVAYDANGATGSMSNSVFAVAKEVSLKKSAFTTPLGYTFAGWATNSVGDVVYADEATGTDFTTTNATLSLYAKWDLDSNGVTATDFTSLTNMLATAAAQSATLPVTIGFTSGVVIPDGETVTLPSGGAFAGIVFVADEGESALWLDDGVLYGDALRGEVTVDALALMKLANGDVVPTAFKALSEGDGGTTVTNDVVVLLGSDGKAYDSIEAVFAAAPLPETLKLFEIDCYTVIFDANGGEGEEMPSQELALGKSLCLERNTYTRTDYVFLGWSTDKDATAPSINNCGAVKNLVEDTGTSVTLYAVWRQPGESDYTIVFVKNEGSGTLVNRVFTNGTKEKLPTLKNLKWERDGYEFLGWATTPAKARAGMVWKANGGVVAAPVEPGETLMVYAIWQLKSGYYEVRYWKNDKPQAPGTDRWRTVAYPYGTGKHMPSIQNGLKWTCDGSTFGGWATSRAKAAAGTVWKADASKLVTAAPEGQTLHVYAIWEPLP